MVNKKFQSSIMTRRRSFPPDMKKGRPKRNLSPKVILEDTVSGISWKEERELKKALYASLQESRRSSRDERPDCDGELSLDSVDSPISNKSTSLGLARLFNESSCSQSSSAQSTSKAKAESNKSIHYAQRKFAQNSMPRLHSETPQEGFQKRIHAQRKFAHGSHPSTPSETPSKPKFKASPVRLFPVRPKTEDFLTYLCFRGTSLLPPHMDLLNVSRDSENIEPSVPLTNGRPGQTRESSPASSSTLSHTNEDSMDIPDLPPRLHTPNRKAARASASTPETARGFLPYPGSNGKNSAKNGSPLSRGKSPGVYSRTRYADRLPASRVLKMRQNGSPNKSSATDRLSLKRRAMATLTSAGKADRKHRTGSLFRTRLSDGDLLKRKVKESCNESDTGSDVNDEDIGSKVVGNIVELDDDDDIMLGKEMCKEFDPGSHVDNNEHKIENNVNIVELDYEATEDYLLCKERFEDFDKELDSDVDGNVEEVDYEKERYYEIESDTVSDINNDKLKDEVVGNVMEVDYDNSLLSKDSCNTFEIGSDINDDKLENDANGNMVEIVKNTSVPGDGNSVVCQCCRIDTNIDVLASECSRCCNAATSVCTFYSNCNTSQEKPKLETCLVSINTQEKNGNDSQLIDNVNIKGQRIIPVQEFTAKFSEQDLNLELNGRCNDVKMDIISADCNGNNSKETIKQNNLKVMKKHNADEAQVDCDCKEQSVSNDIRLTNIEKDTEFVSSLFNPLTSDVDEPFDISEMTDISLNASLDIEELLNDINITDCGMCTPQDTIHNLLNDYAYENKMNYFKDIQGFNGTSNQVSTDVHSNSGLSKHFMNNTKPSQYSDINSNLMFKPAFNSPPRRIFGSIIELPSSISPITGFLKSDLFSSIEDHTYSKTKKPVHFSMKSKCRKVKPRTISQSVSCSIIRTPSKLEYILPRKAVSVQGQEKINELINSTPINKCCDKNQKKTAGSFCTESINDKRQQFTCSQAMFDTGRVSDTECVEIASSDSTICETKKEIDTSPQSKNAKSIPSIADERVSNEVLDQTKLSEYTMSVHDSAVNKQAIISPQQSTTDKCSVLKTTASHVQSIRVTRMQSKREKKSFEPETPKKMKQTVGDSRPNNTVSKEASSPPVKTDAKKARCNSRGEENLKHTSVIPVQSVRMTRKQSVIAKKSFEPDVPKKLKQMVEDSRSKYAVRRQAKSRSLKTDAQKKCCNSKGGEISKFKGCQANLRDRHPTAMHRIEKGHSPSRSNQSKKRKSTSDLPETMSHYTSTSPSKKAKKLRSSERVRKMLKSEEKSQSGRPIHRKYYDDFYETHPIKKLSTNVKAKQVKRKGPVTRASSHLKSMLTSAKLAATRRLRLLKRANQASARDYNRLSHVMEMKRLDTGTPKVSPTTRLTSQKSSPSLPNKGSRPSPNPSTPKCDRFPTDDERANIVTCPTFYPTDDQFKDPLEYIQSIAPKAEVYGICKIVPPASWKMESRVIDDLRFTCQNQHIHKMLHRWGVNAERLEAIKRHFESTGTDKFQCPQIGGVEVDLVKLYDHVQRYGGMKRIVDKKKWMKIADAMKIPKQAQDRITKLYSVYCKFLLSFETLSDEERHKIEHAIQTDRQKHEKHRSPGNTETCIEKGRAQPFSAFNRAARNTQAMFGREESETWEQVEANYWDYVESGQDHVCVQSATLDTSIYGSMFPVRRDNIYSRHPWNLHNFIQSKGCVLHHLGLIADVTVPTLRFGMLYTSTCLSCNSHNLPTVQYLHQGADMIWYAVPKQKTSQLKKALKEVIPSHIRDKGFMVEKDSIMVPPDMLVRHGVPVSRCIQSSREFVVAFSGSYYSNVSCGYTLSESVHYATQSWIPNGYQAAKDLSANHDAELFSMDAMLVFLARDVGTTEEALVMLLPYLKQVVDKEIADRQKLSEVGLKARQRLQNKCARLSPKSDVLEEIVICDVSKKICYLSMVLNESENSAFSLEQGLSYIKKKKKDLPNCKLMYRFSEEELKALVKDVKERIHRCEGHTTPSPTSIKEVKDKTHRGEGHSTASSIAVKDLRERHPSFSSRERHPSFSSRERHPSSSSMKDNKERALRSEGHFTASSVSVKERSHRGDGHTHRGEGHTHATQMTSVAKDTKERPQRGDSHSSPSPTRMTLRKTNSEKISPTGSNR